MTKLYLYGFMFEVFTQHTVHKNNNVFQVFSKIPMGYTGYNAPSPCI